MHGPRPLPHLPAGSRPGRVSLEVAELERSVLWYRRVLGLDVLEAGGGWRRLGVPGDGPVLVEIVEFPGARPAPRGRLGLFHFAILLPDRPALGRFVRHLASSGEQVGAADHLVSEALYLHDPDGLGVEVYADRPREEWRVEGGEIAMASLPLDLEELAASGGGAPWEGAPVGTRMGHIHLHVGDLAAAGRFYGDLLGFERSNTGYPGALFLAAGGYHHHLGVNSWAGPRAVASLPGEARLLEWELVLPGDLDVQATAARLEDAGRRVHPGDDGGWTAEDPWGTVLRVTSASATSPPRSPA